VEAAKQSARGSLFYLHERVIVVSGFIGVLRTIFQTVAETKKIPNWQYQDLYTQKLLYSSNYLKELLKQAKETNNSEQMQAIYDYIKRHNAEDIGNYKQLIKEIDAWKAIGDKLKAADKEQLIRELIDLLL
jgi:hypothetical protein